MESEDIPPPRPASPADSFDKNYWASNQVEDQSSGIMTGFHSSDESQMTHQSSQHLGSPTGSHAGDEPQMTHPPSQGPESPTGFVSSDHGSPVTPSPQPGSGSPTGSEHESLNRPPPTPEASTNPASQSMSAEYQLNAGDLQAALNPLKDKAKAPVQ